MADWQPINTAPKDGTRILATCLGAVVSVHYWRTGPQEGWWREYADGKSWEPTHWMPLPNPDLSKALDQSEARSVGDIGPVVEDLTHYRVFANGKFVGVYPTRDRAIAAAKYYKPYGDGSVSVWECIWDDHERKGSELCAYLDEGDVDDEIVEPGSPIDLMAQEALRAHREGRTIPWP